jgi:hypothetical protein
MVFGIIVALAPFSGLPLSWLEVILPVLGILTAIIGYFLRARRKSAESPAPAVPTSDPVSA